MAHKNKKPNSSHQPYESWQDKVAPVFAIGAAALTLFGIVKTYEKWEDRGKTPSALSAKVHSHTVKSGETEWSLAGLINPKKDPREVVSEIDHLLPPDAAHDNHTVLVGDKIVYQDGHLISYSEPGPK